MKTMNISVEIVKPVAINVDVNIPETAEEWQLITGNHGAEGAAKDLSEELMNLLSDSTLEKEVIWTQMNKVMEQLSYYGAADTEPRAVLSQILEEIFS